MLFALVRKDLIGRYRNSALGFLWHFIVPITTLVVYYVMFSALRENQIDNFVVYLTSGIFLFTFMVSNLISGSGCVTANASLVKKIYFPREILVISQVVTSFIVMILAYCVFFSIFVIIGFSFNLWLLLIVPFFLIIAFMFTLGYTFIFSALNVYYHDIQLFLSSISISFYLATPLFFRINELNESVRVIIWANPFTVFVETMHGLFYYGSLQISLLLICFLVSLISLFIGFYVFGHLKNGFAERL